MIDSRGVKLYLRDLQLVWRGCMLLCWRWLAGWFPRHFSGFGDEIGSCSRTFASGWMSGGIPDDGDGLLMLAFLD